MHSCSGQKIETGQRSLLQNFHLLKRIHCEDHVYKIKTS